MGKRKKAISQLGNAARSGYRPRSAVTSGQAGLAYPRWTFACLDWKFDRLGLNGFPDGTLWKDIHARLARMERMTWDELKAESNHTHPVDLGDLDDAVRKRLTNTLGHGGLPPNTLWQLDLLEGRRLFGRREAEGVFSVIWYDPLHRIFERPDLQTATGATTRGSGRRRG